MLVRAQYCTSGAQCRPSQLTTPSREPEVLGSNGVERTGLEPATSGTLPLSYRPIVAYR